MEPINALSGQASPTGVSASNSFSELGSDDFLKLLITQLTNQDPLEPTGNEELLNQISSIRDIELSTSLSDSLKSLTGQQNFSSASSMIGKYVTTSGESGSSQSGLVVGVRFESSGNAVLQFANGQEAPMAQVVSIQPTDAVAEQLIGQSVIGVDDRSGAQPTVVQGIVTGVRKDPNGEVMLELDTGEELRFQDFVNVAPQAA